MGPRDYFQSSRGPHYAAQADRFLQVPMEPSDVCLSLFEWLHEWPKQTGMMIDRMSPPGGPGVFLGHPEPRYSGARKRGLFVYEETCMTLSRLYLLLAENFLVQALIAINSYTQS